MVLQYNRIKYTDWDILIIVDGCRYDVFKEEYTKVLGNNNGTLEMVLSRHIGTESWVCGNFSGRNCGDIIYLTPVVKFKEWLSTWQNKHTFLHVEEVWKKKWNADYGTLLPEDMTDTAFEFLDKYPSKKFIVHYIQPHWPYIYNGGRRGLAWELHPDGKVIKKKASLKRVLSIWAEEIMPQEIIWRIGNIFGLIPKYDIGYLWCMGGRDKIMEGYREDLKRALYSIKKIIDKYPNKKIVITADHGEEFGDEKKRIYRTAGLVRIRPKTRHVAEVPWYVVGKR